MAGKAVQGVQISGGLTVETLKDRAPEWMAERLTATPTSKPAGTRNLRP